MYQINKDVVYVRGAQKGAIYDFKTHNVYWISNESCELIDKYIKTNCDLCSFSENEKVYIDLLISKKLMQTDYQIREYIPTVDKTQKLDMAWLEITQACNCKCLHCYQGEDHINKNDNVLSLDDWKRIISDLASIKVSRVVVIGGEPCLHNNIYEILMELYKKGIKTTLFTNATIFDSRLMNLIIKYSDKISLKVSLYGDNALDHDLITQHPGSFNKLVSNVKKLTSSGVTVYISVVAMRENQDKLYNIKDFIHSLGAKYTKFDVIRNVFGGTQDQHTPTNPEIINSCQFCQPNFKANKQRFDDNCYKNSCWYGKVAITETGDVLPCVFERNMVYGNVKKTSIPIMLKSELLKKYWYMDFKNVDFCKACEFKYSCKDCRPLGVSVNGNISSKNPRCKYNPFTGEWG